MNMRRAVIFRADNGTVAIEPDRHEFHSVNLVPDDRFLQPGLYNQWLKAVPHAFQQKGPDEQLEDDKGRDRISRHAEDGLFAYGSEKRGFARFHRNTVEFYFSAKFLKCFRYKIKVAGRNAARYQYDVGFGQRLFNNRFGCFSRVLSNAVIPGLAT